LLAPLSKTERVASMATALAKTLTAYLQAAQTADDKSAAAHIRRWRAMKPFALN
jgi:hypothetical protein